MRERSLTMRPMNPLRSAADARRRQLLAHPPLIGLDRQLQVDPLQSSRLKTARHGTRYELIERRRVMEAPAAVLLRTVGTTPTYGAGALVP